MMQPSSFRFSSAVSEERNQNTNCLYVPFLPSFLFRDSLCWPIFAESTKKGERGSSKGDI